MKDKNDYPVPSGRDLIENIEYSPYYNVAREMILRRNITNKNSDYYLADFFDAFHEIAKMDNKINKGKK